MEDLLDKLLVSSGKKKEVKSLKKKGEGVERKLKKISKKKAQPVTTREEGVEQGIIPPSDEEAAALGIPKVDLNDWYESVKSVKSLYSKSTKLEISNPDERRKQFYDMDLMQLMKLDAEYTTTREFLSNPKSMLPSTDISVFELTTSALGGV